MLSFLLTVSLLAGGISAASPSLVGQRQVVMRAASRQNLASQHPSCGESVDARTNIVAFPAGRADRMYIYSLGIGRAYRWRRGLARLVWCGKAIYTPQDAKRWASPLFGNAARALGYPFGSKWGRLPLETSGMDIYSDFAGTLTTARTDAAGWVLCTVSRGDPARGEFADVFQFDARDTCP